MTKTYALLLPNGKWKAVTPALGSLDASVAVGLYATEAEAHAACIEWLADLAKAINSKLETTIEWCRKEAGVEADPFGYIKFKRAHLQVDPAEVEKAKALLELAGYKAVPDRPAKRLRRDAGKTHQRLSNPLSMELAKEIRALYAEGSSAEELKEAYGVASATLLRCLANKTFKDPDYTPPEVIQ